MNDLKMDAFPRFIVSDFYKRYIRTKYIETVKVTIKDFTTFRVLGRGGFGAVHACRKKNSGTIYAMKCINKKLVKVTYFGSSLCHRSSIHRVVLFDG
jgi:rhodopsin kinase